MAYDSQSDRIIIFGGNTGGSLFTVVNETWAYDYNTNTWTNLNPPVSPSPRIFHTMAYDSLADRIVLFGGERAVQAGDTWAYDFNTNTWTNLNPPVSPSPRSAHAMAYDSRSDRIILFGGASQGGFVDDTWAYDFNTNTWTNLSSFTGPAARILHAMAFDALSDRVVLFGGYSTEVHWSNDTWSYDFNTNTWTNLSPPVSPSPRTGHAMAYDSRSDRIITFGGYIAVLQRDNETWAYDLDTNAWTEMHPSISPLARADHAMAYDARSDRILMFGGSVDGPDPTETWSYQFEGPPPAEFQWITFFSYVAATSVGVMIVSLLWRRRRKLKGVPRGGQGSGHQPPH